MNKLLLAGGLWALFVILLTDKGQEMIKTLGGNVTDLIKKFEGFSSTAYYDIAGKLTIGYGHLIKSGEQFSSVTREQAEKLLNDDVKFAANAVANYVRVPLSENQKNALISFVYNVGANAFKNSTMLSLLNAGNYSGAAEQFGRWVNAGGKFSQGLANRRAEEKTLFLKG